MNDDINKTSSPPKDSHIKSRSRKVDASPKKKRAPSKGKARSKSKTRRKSESKTMADSLQATHIVTDEVAVKVDAHEHHHPHHERPKQNGVSLSGP